jgi:hypothetical protein
MHRTEFNPKQQISNKLATNPESLGLNVKVQALVKLINMKELRKEGKYLTLWYKHYSMEVS